VYPDSEALRGSPTKLIRTVGKNALIIVILKFYMNKLSKLLIVFLVILTSCNETFESKYVDYSEYCNADIGSQSWIPKILTTDTYEIWEIHNIDNNCTLGKFKYYNASYVDTLLYYDKVEESYINDFEVNLRKIKIPKKPKWFDLNTQRKNLLAYKIDKFNLLIDIDNKQVYFIFTY